MDLDGMEPELVVELIADEFFHGNYKNALESEFMRKMLSFTQSSSIDSVLSELRARFDIEGE